MRSSATFDATRRYRYRLARIWDHASPRVLFIMLNPSTADESTDDATIRRCVAFARCWHMGGVEVANLFAWRARDPADLRRAADPVGPDNDRILSRLAARAARIIAAWGDHGRFGGRAQAVLSMLARRKILCLGVTRRGQPRHPLFTPASTSLERFTFAPAQSAIAHLGNSPASPIARPSERAGRTRGPAGPNRQFIEFPATGRPGTR